MFGTRIPALLLGIYVVQVTKISDFKGSVLPTYRLTSYIYIYIYTHIHIYISSSSSSSSSFIGVTTHYGF